MTDLGGFVFEAAVGQSGVHPLFSERELRTVLHVDVVNLGDGAQINVHRHQHRSTGVCKISRQMTVLLWASEATTMIRLLTWPGGIQTSRPNAPVVVVQDALDDLLLLEFSLRFRWRDHRADREQQSQPRAQLSG